MSKRVLILGGSGRFGSNCAAAFWNAGWKVKSFERAKDDLDQEVARADVVVNGWNPLYNQWEEQLPKLTQRLLTAMEGANATLLQPLNVYVYGQDAPQTFEVETEHGATNPLGRIRIDLETALRGASFPVIFLRAGDFIDTSASGNWLDRIILAKVSKGVAQYPGALDAAHAWAYLPDLGRAAVQLAEKRADLSQFTEVNFPGYTLTGREVASLASKAVGRPIRLKQMSWLPIALLRPFWPIARYLIEMRYLWNKPHRVSSKSLDEVLPEFVATPAEEAISTAISGILDGADTASKPGSGGTSVSQMTETA